MARTRRESKFEVFGEEMLEKVVAKSGSSGRVYLPPDWIGKRDDLIHTFLDAIAPAIRQASEPAAAAEVAVTSRQTA